MTLYRFHYLFISYLFVSLHPCLEVLYYEFFLSLARMVLLIKRTNVILTQAFGYLCVELLVVNICEMMLSIYLLIS